MTKENKIGLAEQIILIGIAFVVFCFEVHTLYKDREDARVRLYWATHSVGFQPAPNPTFFVQDMPGNTEWEKLNNCMEAANKAVKQAQKSGIPEGATCDARALGGSVRFKGAGGDGDGGSN
jgi:hypothetical protein